MPPKLLRLLQSPGFIFLAALLLRLAFLLYKIHDIPPEALASLPFQNEVGNVASALASGHGYCCLFRQPTGPTAWLAPIYPLLIAAIFKLFGTFTFPSFCAAAVLNSLFSALVCFPLYSVAQRIASKPTAVLAAWLWVFSPIAIILPYAWIWDSSLAAFLAISILWATLLLADRPACSRFPYFALYGLLWGISLLTNPALSALLPFLVARLFFRLRFNTSRKAQLLLLTCASILLTCLPWTLRNYAHFHRFIPLRSNFPYEFWSGNNAIFDPDSRELNRITRYEQTGLYAHLGESAFLDEKWHLAKTFIRRHPSLYAHLCAQRILATWFGTDSPLQDFLRADSSLARLLLLWNASSILAVLLGLVLLYLRRREHFLSIAVFPLILPITFYLTHTSLRHRHPCDPVLVLLIAFALTSRHATNPPPIS
jgi:ABC-type transport system involved in cytochrome c biogenesis permease component